MNLDDRFHEILDEAAEDEARETRSELAGAILVGPFDDFERGPGFAIFIGEWRIGWWATRVEAALEAMKLGDAVRKHPLDREKRRNEAVQRRWVAQGRPRP